MPDPVPPNEDANRNVDVPYDSEVEHVDKLGEHKGGGFCSQVSSSILKSFSDYLFCMRPDMEAVNDAVVQEDLVVVKNVEFKDEEDSVLAEKAKKIVPEEVIDGQ